MGTVIVRVSFMDPVVGTTTEQFFRHQVLLVAFTGVKSDASAVPVFVLQLRVALPFVREPDTV
jgi:hypothetical protein